MPLDRVRKPSVPPSPSGCLARALTDLSLSATPWERVRVSPSRSRGGSSISSCTPPRPAQESLWRTAESSIRALCACVAHARDAVEHSLPGSPL
jgi:hypothetical protein